MSERFEPGKEVVSTELDNSEIALLDLNTKTYFSLNSTGACIWAGLEDGMELAEITVRLQREFDVNAATAVQSVIALVEQLLDQGLVRRAATGE